MTGVQGGPGRWVVRLLTTSLVALPLWTQSEPGTVAGVSKISRTEGGWRLPLRVNDQIGRGIAALGDLDGNGVVDLAVSGHGDDDGGLNQGAVHLVFLEPDGWVRRQTKINDLRGGFTGDLDPGDQFGRALANLGDLDGDGVTDLAVGSNLDDDGGADRGAVWLLTLEPSGSVVRTTKISSTQGGLVGPLRNGDEFGRSVASPGDLDGDGVPDLAVGAPLDGTGGSRRGAVWILFMRADGSVRDEVKLASGRGGFGPLRNLDWWGFSLAPLGDLDGDGVPDLVVGAALDDDGGTNAGAIWILRMHANGTVKSYSKISMTMGGFAGALESPDQFGTSVSAVGDLDGNGVTDLAVGAVKDGDGGTENGAVYIIFLTPEGTALGHQKISETSGGLEAQLDRWDWFGSAVAPLGDFNGDGVPDLAVGARNDDDGVSNGGALYLTYLNGSSQPSEPPEDPDPPEDPEPDPPVAGGSLELLTHDASPGTTVVLRAGVPEAWRDRSVLATLLFSPFPAVAPYGPFGLRLDSRSILTASQATVPAFTSTVDLSLLVPDNPSLVGRVLTFQTLWRSGGERQLSDAVEVLLQ